MQGSLTATNEITTVTVADQIYYSTFNAGTRLGTVKAILAARLAAPGTANGPDRLLTAQEVHERTTFSVDWLYRHANALPFARRVGRKVLFSEAGLAKWLAKRAP